MGLPCILAGMQRSRLIFAAPLMSPPIMRGSGSAAIHANAASSKTARRSNIRCSRRHRLGAYKFTTVTPLTRTAIARPSSHGPVPRRVNGSLDATMTPPKWYLRLATNLTWRYPSPRRLFPIWDSSNWLTFVSCKSSTSGGPPGIARSWSYSPLSRADCQPLTLSEHTRKVFLSSPDHGTACSRCWRSSIVRARWLYSLSGQYGCCAAKSRSTTMLPAGRLCSE